MGRLSGAQSELPFTLGAIGGPQEHATMR